MSPALQITESRACYLLVAVECRPSSALIVVLSAQVGLALVRRGCLLVLEGWGVVGFVLGMLRCHLCYCHFFSLVVLVLSSRTPTEHDGSASGC